VERDDKVAFKWLQLPAVKNDIKAKYSLAMMYTSGLRIAKDILKAKQSAGEGYEAGDEICKMVRDKNHLKKLLEKKSFSHMHKIQGTPVSFRLLQDSSFFRSVFLQVLISEDLRCAFTIVRFVT